MFRRGRRHEAQTELRSQGEEEQPFWLAVKGAEPGRELIAPKVALLRYDSPPWLANQPQWQRQQPHPQHAPSPLRGVSTQEVLEALGSVFSPTELDWELVGVTFVQASPDPATPRESPVEVIRDEPPWAVESQAPSTEANTTGLIAQAFIPNKPRKWLPEHDEVLASVRDLAWDGYRSLIADIFRREGYEVFTLKGLMGM